MSWINLTSGIIMRLLEAKPDELDEIYSSGPILQFLSYKPVNGNRYIIILSDGEGFTQSLLAPELNNLVEEGKIENNTIALVEKWTLNKVRDQRLIFIQGVKILGKTEDPIGNLESVDNKLRELERAANKTTTPSAVGSSSVQTHSSAPPSAPVQQTVFSLTRPGQSMNNQSRPPAADRSTHTIDVISPFINKWTIRARVTHKSGIKAWSNQNRQGKLLNCMFTDESGEIRATAFNEYADAMFNILQEGSVYYVSKCRVTKPNKKFSKHEFELHLDQNTEIEECLDEAVGPMVKYEFKPFEQLHSVAKDTTCDVIGVVISAAALSNIISKKNGQTYIKRELRIVDQSNVVVPLTLWGEDAEQYNAEDYAVIAFKGVKIGDFNGRSLSMMSSSSMAVNPDIPEAHALRVWYDDTGCHDINGIAFAGPSGLSSSSNGVVTLAELKEAQLGQSKQAQPFSTKATVANISHTKIVYPGCATCSKKVIQTSEGWKCEKCDMISARPDYRYFLSMSVADYSDQAFFQGFNDIGLKVFDMSANELMHLKETDESAYEAILHNASCQTYNFTCLAKQDTYNNRTRTRYDIQNIVPLDYRAEASLLRDQLRAGLKE